MSDGSAQVIAGMNRLLAGSWSAYAQHLTHVTVVRSLGVDGLADQTPRRPGRPDRASAGRRRRTPLSRDVPGIGVDDHANVRSAP